MRSIMRRLITLCLWASVFLAGAWAQAAQDRPAPLPAPVVAAPDPAWTVSRSRSAIELLPQLRVRFDPSMTRDAPAALVVLRHAAHEANIGSVLHGVAYNHAMQAYGLLSGEISLRVVNGADGFEVARQAGFEASRIGRSEQWVGHLASPRALRDALLLLRAHPWVVEADWVIRYELPRQALDAARATPP